MISIQLTASIRTMIRITLLRINPIDIRHKFQWSFNSATVATGIIVFTVRAIKQILFGEFDEIASFTFILTL